MNVRISRYGKPVKHARLTGPERYALLKKWWALCRRFKKRISTVDCAEMVGVHFVTLYAWERAVKDAFAASGVGRGTSPANLDEIGEAALDFGSNRARKLAIQAEIASLKAKIAALQSSLASL